MLLRRPVVVALFLSIALAGLAARAAAAPVWHKIEAPGVVVYSDASERAAIDCTVRYLSFRDVFRQLFVAPGHTMPPSIVILFRDRDEFEEHLGPNQQKREDFHTVNLRTEIDGADCSAFSIEDDRDAALKMTFEFETIWAMPHLGYYVPLWMAQGSGEILSGISIHADYCLVGADDHSRVGEAVPWERFFAIDASSKLYNDTDRLPDYLAQAWAVMHWVLFNDTDQRTRFSDLAHRLRTASPVEALSQAMATTPDHFNAAIRGHFRHGRFPLKLPVDQKALRAALRVSPVDPMEILVRRAELLIGANRAIDAEPMIDQAHAYAPDLPAVKAAWARRLRRDGRSSEAAEVYRELEAAGVTTADALIFSASARLDDMQTGGRDTPGGGGEPAALAVAEIRRALTLDPGNLEAGRLLGRAFYTLPQLTDDAVAALDAIAPPGPDGIAIRFYRALICQRLGHVDDAVATLRGIEAEPNALPSVIRQAAAQRTWMVLDRARQQLTPLIEAHDFAAAHQLLASTRTALGAAGDDDPCHDLARWVDENEAWQKLREAYEARRWSEARDAAVAYADTYGPSQRASYARRVVAEAAKSMASTQPDAAPAATSASPAH